MKKDYWFASKKYGWGFVPTTWQGALATIAFVLLLGLSAFINQIYLEPTPLQNQLRFLLDILMLSSIFTVLFKDKVKGGLRWRWGK